MSQNKIHESLQRKAEREDKTPLTVTHNRNCCTLSMPIIHVYRVDIAGLTTGLTADCLYLWLVMTAVSMHYNAATRSKQCKLVLHVHERENKNRGAKDSND